MAKTPTGKSTLPKTDARPPAVRKKEGRSESAKEVSCPVESTLEAIGGRWKVLIIYHLLEATHRFGELTRLLQGVSARTLTRQLRELEESGIIDRHVHQVIPPKVEYSLTDLGRALEPVLQAMHAWGEQVDSRRK
ncbi:winged helix-turn-helix transcriptional regulator [Lignipirellula cremea]|uniref:Putative HTH-type transcriptional regulator YybR n=1 Tax=Lignipirellula cremea TaxID=2528010 RepID=A0A518DZ05_9BACT|nr:helix-turn-helix domain-containing protein [Lignipirellula cremea]QDU97031.1 putative HTH-type transcriptional regulator YybR [Lignipirellula cremea]